MSLLGIGFLIFIGLLLVLLEIFIIPGVGITGIGGLALLASGIYLAYTHHGIQTGHYVMGSTVGLLVVLLYFSFKSRTWDRLALNTEITAKVDLIGVDVKVGDSGVTVSRLAPMGKVLVNNTYFEAKSRGTYIDADIAVKVVKISDNTLVVDVIEKTVDTENLPVV